MSFPSFDERVRETERRLLEWCRSSGRHVTADAAVYEEVAALLLDRSSGTLANWRALGGAGVAWYRAGRTGRVRYRLRDLAAYLERQRQEEP